MHRDRRAASAQHRQRQGGLVTIRTSAEWQLTRWNDAVGYWLVLLIPAALVSASGVADVCCSIVAILFVALSTARGDWSWLRRPWIACMALLWGYLCLRSLLSAHPVHSFGAAVIWLRYVVLAVAVGEMMQDDGKRNRLLTILVWSVLFLSADTLLQYCIGVDIMGRQISYITGNGGTGLGSSVILRLSGPFSRDFVGVTIAWLVLPPLLWLLDRRRWLLAAVLGLCSLLAVALSGERMGLVTIGLYAVCLIALLPRWRWWLLGAIGLIVLMLGLALASRPILYERLFSIWQVLIHFGRSSYVILWKGGWALGMTHPIFGIGVANYRKACLDPALGPLLVPPNSYPRCSTHPHNFYLEWFIAGGFPAIAAFIASMILLMRDLFRYRGVWTWLFAGLAATILVRLWPLGPTTSFFHSWFAIPLFLYVGLALSYLPALELRPEPTDISE
jgi:hypothetical protein